ncbi:MAG: hypothetical protein C0469_04830 [Cyanobacteria bacterium DS2.3.42]|nr:hypothetical protein [Cyanobacteria bacterium DS2.3.42]
MTQETQKYLAVQLDEESRQTVQKLALYEEIRGDHVTLAYAHNGESFSPDWIPGGRLVGDSIEFETRGFSVTEDIQVLVISIDGTTKRPFDGGTLHVTVSKRTGVPSTHANEAILNVTLVPFTRQLKGSVTWLERRGTT